MKSECSQSNQFQLHFYQFFSFKFPNFSLHFPDFFFSYILRMKEYERERRLMVRRERIAAKKANETLAA